MSQRYGLRPVRLEQWDQNQWSKCADGMASFLQSGDFGVRAYSGARTGCVVKSLPGARLRRRQTPAHGVEKDQFQSSW